MISVHLYGKLRRFTGDSSATSASIATLDSQEGDTVRTVVDRLGIPHGELGSNMFLNGRYADFETAVADGDRLGLFPDDMQLLYKWYFSPANLNSEVAGSGASEPSTEAAT